MRKFLSIAFSIILLAFSSCSKGREESINNSSINMEQANSLFNATPQELEGIQKALNSYIEAAVKGDSKIAKPVFTENATISHVENDSLISGPIQELFDYYDQTGPHHAEYQITSAQVADNVAVVSIDSKFGDIGFDDMFTLVKDGDGWKIVSKVFHVK